MVDGTGLENQQINVSQVRILSLPPGSLNGPKGHFLASLVNGMIRAEVRMERT